MQSSIEEVASVLSGWKDDKGMVAVVITSDRKGDFVKFGGILVEVKPVALNIFGNEFGVEINLSVATLFEWQDPRGAPPESRMAAMGLYDSFLVIRTPLYICWLFAFKCRDEQA